MRVFISYAREDEPFAAMIYDQLELLPGVIPWMDKKCLLPGDDWKSEISHAIHSSDLVILLLSSSSVDKTGYVQREVREALEAVQSRPPDMTYLMPVRLNFCEPKFHELRRLHWADMFPSWDDGLNTLRRAIAKRQERDLEIERASDKQQMQKNAADAAKVSEQLPNDLKDNLRAYGDWVLRHEYSTYPYAAARKHLPNCTRQAPEDWLVRLFTLGALSKPNESGEFTDVGIELVELLGSSNA